jgi:hypothetical protein
VVNNVSRGLGTLNQRVEGSNPSSPTNKIKHLSTIYPPLVQEFGPHLADQVGICRERL